MSDPVAISKDSSQSLGLSTLDLRQGLGALSAPSTGSTFGNLSGVFPGGTSAAGLSNDCLATSTSGSGMATTVNGGHYAVARGNSVYLGMVTGAVTVTHDPSNPSNPRIDYVIIRTRDPGVDTNVTESAKVVILKGDAAASPNEPSGQMTDGDLLLAAVTVRANTGSTIASDYSDRRLFVEARGGIRLRTNRDTRPGSYEGQAAYNVDLNMYEGWTGSEWMPWGSLTGWQQFTGQLYYGGNGFNGGTVVANRGTGATTSCRYQRIGKRLDVRYVLGWGTAPYNMGSGMLNLQLPAGFRVTVDQHVFAMLGIVDPNGNFFNYPGEAFVRAGSHIVWPQFVRSRTDSTLSYYTAATSQGTAGTGTPLIPGGFPQGGGLWIAGTFEIE